MIEKTVVSLDKEKLRFEEKIDFLLSGGCKSIFPISIAEDAQEVRGFYKTAGYRPLSALEYINAFEALNILEKTIDAIEECGEYLIFPEEFIISMETVYMDKSFSRAKITYIPSDDDDGVLPKLSNLIAGLKEIASENGRLYLNMMEEFLSVENLSRQKVKVLLLQLKEKLRFAG